MEEIDLIPFLQICLADNCGSLKITDITGLYDSEENVGGYGSETQLPEDATSAILVVTYPNGETTSINLTSAVVENTVPSGEYPLGTYPIEDYVDGEYHFLYTISFGDTSYTYEETAFLVCSVRCCVDKLWAKIATSVLCKKDCFCGDVLMKKALQAEALFKGIESASLCGNEIRQPLLEKLERICKLEKCNCK
jgi:hypothetical protein